MHGNSSLRAKRKETGMRCAKPHVSLYSEHDRSQGWPVPYDCLIYATVNVTAPLVPAGVVTVTERGPRVAAAAMTKSAVSVSRLTPTRF